MLSCLSVTLVLLGVHLLGRSCHRPCDGSTVLTLTLRLGPLGEGLRSLDPGAQPPFTASDVLALPPGGLASRCGGRAPAGNGGAGGPPTWAEVFQWVKAEALPGEDLCYWAFETLPPPGVDPATGPYESTHLRKEADLALAAAAATHDRLAKEASPAHCTYGCGTVLWAGMALGSELTRRLCEDGTPTTDHLCTEAHLRQAWRWPVLGSLVRLNGTNAAALLSVAREQAGLLQELPLSAGGQQPAPSQAEPSTAGRGVGGVGSTWGQGTSVHAKLLPCSSLPAAFRPAAYPPPTLSELVAGGLTHLDAALEVWASLKGLLPASLGLVRECWRRGGAPPP